MEQRALSYELRNETGKGICRRLRAQGLIPGVVFGKGMDSVPVTVNPKDLIKAIEGEGGHNRILTLQGGGELNGQMAIVTDILFGSLKGEPRHVDLHKINMAEKVRVNVGVNLVGTAAGVKDGGMLDLAMHEVEIECLPGQIPEHIDVDVTSLKIGGSIHVADLQVAAGIKVLDDPRASVVSILGKAKEEAPAAAE